MWTTRTLGDICDDVDGVIQTGPFGSQLHESDYVANGVPVVMPKNILDGKIDTSDIAFIRQEDADRLHRHKMTLGDIVYGRRGDIGRRGLIGERENGWFCGTGCLRVGLGDRVLDPRYLYYYLGQPSVVSWIANQAVGATMPNLNTGILRSVVITYPRLPVQQRIGSILSAYDDLIENNTRRITLLEQMAQMIYREWFVNFRFPGHENVRMVESELGPIPEGWRSGILRDVCESLDYGYTVSATYEPIGPRFLRITDIVPSVIDWQRVPYCPPPETSADKYTLREGDIVVARTGATTGYAKRLNKRHPASIFASYLVRLRIKAGFSNHLFGVLVESDEYKRFIKANWSGAAQPQANAQVLTSIPILMSPEPLQRQFSEMVEPLLDLKEALHFKNLALRTTRDFLLPKLISGEVPVEAADETAAELMGQSA